MKPVFDIHHLIYRNITIPDIFSYTRYDTNVSKDHFNQFNILIFLFKNRFASNEIARPFVTRDINLRSLTRHRERCTSHDIRKII